MDGLRAEKVHPKRISKLTEIIQNVQKDRNYKKRKQKMQKTDTESVRLINIPDKEKQIGHNPWLVLMLYLFCWGSHLH